MVPKTSGFGNGIFSSTTSPPGDRLKISLRSFRKQRRDEIIPGLIDPVYDEEDARQRPAKLRGAEPHVSQDSQKMCHVPYY
jgi:hypothetical protein